MSDSASVLLGRNIWFGGICVDCEKFQQLSVSVIKFLETPMSTGQIHVHLW